MKVVVIGAAGKMGSTTCAAVEAADDLELAGRLDVGDDVAAGLAGADVAVVFSVPDTALEHVLACVEAGVHAVVGTTGWDADKLAVLDEKLAAAPGVGVLIAPNFAIGAILLMEFAARAAPYF